ncbi:MAG: hypothetical protein HYR56_34125 [Acidobacteria bacterium]|nr:hypothetical protein [Acidobacteriota bacterium]MBI3422132.1 hypothetical protein [Acidobacteriota bacterium]
MQFQQNAEVPLLYVAADNGAAPAGTLLYLLPPGSASTPAAIALADSWKLFSGVYLFLAQPLAAGQAQTFVNAAQKFLADPRMQQTRFVWFNPPYEGQLLTGQNIALNAPQGNSTTAAAASFVFQNLTFTLQAGAAATLDEANAAFSFTAATAQDFFLQTATTTLYNLGPQLSVPLMGALAGCLQFTLPLQFDPAHSVDNLADLDIGLRYFYAEAFDASGGMAGDADFFLGTMRYPVFSQGLTLYANLDPLAALNPARSFFAFNGADAGQAAAGAAPAVTTYYSGTLGDALSLLPLPASAASTAFAALVFAVNQGASAQSASDPYYLVPRGDFVWQSQRRGAVELMCGLSGVEYVGLTLNQAANEAANEAVNEAALQTLVSFFPGHEAFAFGFQPGQKPGVNSLKPTDAPTTAFATVTAAADALDYFAQPDQSVLYNYDTSGTLPLTPPGAQVVTALAAVPVQAATLTWPPASAPVFPLLPYAGLSGQDLAAYQQLESQIVNPARRQALTAAPPQARPRLTDAPASPFNTTPQGLLADYASGEIVLAQMTLPQSGAQTPAQLRLENVANELLGAFQSSKMFLVVSDPGKLTGVLPAQYDQLILGLDPKEAWQFDLDPAQWQANGTIGIIKFYDLSIAALLGQTSAWASGDFFNNGSAANAASVIQTIIAEADAGDSDFAAFFNAVNNPHWNGILWLNVRAPLAELPPELAGLAVGIDQSRFRAHHVGINAAKINAPATPGPITIAPSSIFGLIHYQAPAPLQPGLGDYQFEVAQLKVLFLNSAVAGFSSVIDLQINTLFGEAATLEGTPDNIVKLYGVYQKHVVNGQTQESYLFQTQSGQAATFNMQSNVLNAVQLTKGQFVTVTSQNQGKDTAAQTVSQFVFWGLLDFRALSGFDLFSFGRADKADAPAGLNFSKLVIEMDFDPAATPPTPQFTFDASQLAFDLAASTARANSFYQHFPLTVGGFTQAREGATPDGQGFMSVQTPLNQSTLSYPWYSLNFNLNLGSPGALAAQAGFIASLTAAWSPVAASGGAYQVFTGLKLPGSSGAKREISIEGLFNITFKTLALIAKPESDTFILVLYNIGFKFLSFAFPPAGQVNFVLFGDPQQTAGGNASLGWYAAYAKPDAQQPPAPKTVAGVSDKRRLANNSYSQE